MKFIDEMIQEAQKRGDFDGLKGEGKPLELEDNPFNRETRLAHSIVKQAGYTLGFIVERRTLEAEIAAVRDTLQRAARRNQKGAFAALRWRKAEESFRKDVTELNKKIRNYNLKAPREQFHLFPLDIEHELTRLKPPTS